MSRLWTVYGLSDPATGEIKYVGLSTSPKTRIHGHISDAVNRRSANTELGKWIRELHYQSTRPLLVILMQGIGERSSAITAEKKYIADLPNLLNKSHGGEIGPIGNFGITMPCGWKCGKHLTATQMREHFTNCPKRPKK